MSAFTELARAITAKAKEVRASEHLATVLRQDAEGTYWVSIPGGADESPISTAMTNAMPGDTVRVSIANGRSVMTGNVTSPSATTMQVGKVSQIANKAMTTAYTESARIDNLEATALTAQSALIGELVSEAAKIEDLTAEQIAAIAAYIGTLVANEVTAANIVSDNAYIAALLAGDITAETISAASAYISELLADSITASDIASDHAIIQDLDVSSLTAEFAKIDFANVESANIAVAKVRELFARSGWFDSVTITGDASITGQLKGVLVDGDTARFRNIYADALKLLGPDGLYYALNLAGLDASQAAALIAQYPGEELEGGLHGSHIIAESITATQVDVSSLRAAMLLAQAIQVGATEGIHTEMTGDRFSFLAPGYHLPKYQPTEDTSAVSGKVYYEYDQASDTYSVADTSDPGCNPAQDGLYEAYVFDASTPVSGEVAYIAVDPTTNESMFYMSRAVVVKDLRFGNWKWADRANGNMALRWMGSSQSAQMTARA